jgi:hypothetical protein
MVATYVWHCIDEAAQGGAWGDFSERAGGEVDHCASIQEGELGLKIEVWVAWDGEGEIDRFVGWLHGVLCACRRANDSYWRTRS